MFAWVDSSQTTFRRDDVARSEEILEIQLEHDEGRVPEPLSITIKNPRTGLLNANRYQWAWLAYQPPLLDPYMDDVFDGPGDFSKIPNGYGSSGATDNTPATVIGTPSGFRRIRSCRAGRYTTARQLPLFHQFPRPPNFGILSPTAGAEGPPPYTNGNTVVPIFFGELIGVPDDFGEKVTLKFLARSMNYIKSKQAYRGDTTTSPNYDPIFLKDTERDDPDKILEGWSMLYHVDRTSLAVTASDVLVGEDGTVVFTESPPTTLYNSVKVKIGQAPLTDVQVQVTVHWTQRTLGYVKGPSVSVQSYTGSTFMDEWPKPGKSLGAGWTVESSFVNDPFMVKHTPDWHMTTDIQFYGSAAQYDCSIVSINESNSQPALLGPSLNGNIIPVYGWIDGVCNPYSTPAS